MKEVAGYQIEGPLGRGAASSVYRARAADGRPVALKLLAGGQPLDEKRQQRFQQEATAHVRLDHPHVVKLHEARIDQGRAVLVQELIEGEDLDKRLSRDGPLPIEEALTLGCKLARALAYVHDQGVLHRDLKPANVMLDPQGEPRLVDFGLAKLDSLEGSRLTQSGAFLGTPGYWPPEQAGGRLREIGPASDVYSLGALVYALLTGQPPHAGNMGPAGLASLEAGRVAPPSRRRAGVPPGLDAVLLRCLETVPARRYPSARSLAAALERLAAPPAPASTPPAALALAAVILLAGGLIAGAVLGGRPAPPADLSTPPVTPPSALELLETASRAAAPDKAQRYDAALAQLGRENGFDAIPDAHRPALAAHVYQTRASTEPDAARQLELLRLALRIDPGCAPALFSLASRLTRRDDLQEAELYASGYIDLEPEVSQGYDLRAQIRASRSDLPGAITDLTRAQELKPSADRLLDRAQLWLRQGQRALALADMELGSAGLQHGPRAEEASEALTRLRDAADPRALVDASSLLRRAGAPRLAGSLLDLALERDPDYLPALRRRGLATASLDDLRRALELDPEHVTTHAFLAAVLITTPEAQAAAPHARFVLERPEAASPLERSMALHARALLRGRTGDREGSLSDLDACLELQPDHAHARALRAVLRASFDDLPGAREDADRALASPSLQARIRGELHGLRALARESAGDLPGAAQDFRDALRLLPLDHPAREGSVRDAERLREHLPAHER